MRDALDSLDPHARKRGRPPTIVDRVETRINLSREQLDWLTQRAAEIGVSRAELIRDLVDAERENGE